MHILLLTAVVLSGLVWGIVNLQREMRRRQWEKQNVTPLFAIEKPRELVATLGLALLKCGGDLTMEQKDSLIRLYEEELQFSPKEAIEMYSYASYLISTDPNYAEKVKDICAPAMANFSDSQRESAMDLLAGLVDTLTDGQQRLLNEVRMVFDGCQSRPL